jgi:hypothetical protein
LRFRKIPQDKGANRILTELGWNLYYQQRNSFHNSKTGGKLTGESYREGILFHSLARTTPKAEGLIIAAESRYSEAQI